ncbi:MAG: glycosyltransferase family 4 protein [Candidatus Moranbacteria bacterium]|nr:glycosyltransferase family 4 protein [Candidatus Moranbacteria bacterium]
MKIGIDASRAFIQDRTGIEEYAYQVIKNMEGVLADDDVRLYIRGQQQEVIKKINFPERWEVRTLKARRLWTLGRLSIEMGIHSIDALFIPSHVVPPIRPKNTTVTIHGLEYEKCPEAYRPWERFYMRQAITHACKWAKKIIAVSQNTKKDLIKIYKVPEEKITVIYEGYETKWALNEKETLSIKRNLFRKFAIDTDKPYYFFVGRIEKRKNIETIVKAFNICKKLYRIPHVLVLAGAPGHGFQEIQKVITDSPFKSEIVQVGFVSAKEKEALFKEADVFVFPTIYEGFGLPILEAQSVGVPVITSNRSSMPEVAGKGALLVNPQDEKTIARTMHMLVAEQETRKKMVHKGRKNIERFSWKKCAKEIADVVKKG